MDLLDCFSAKTAKLQDKSNFLSEIRVDRAANDYKVKEFEKRDFEG